MQRRDKQALFANYSPQFTVHFSFTSIFSIRCSIFDINQAEGLIRASSRR